MTYKKMIESVVISIHAPKRERPYGCFLRRSIYGISIHAPKRERLLFVHFYPSCVNFNPRSQAGATICSFVLKCGTRYFNPRSQAGATCLCWQCLAGLVISIHAPKRERHPMRPKQRLPSHFNPRSQAGATVQKWSRRAVIKISIHAPKRERPLP